jgi:hypothetical protein
MTDEIVRGCSQSRLGQAPQSRLQCLVGLVGVVLGERCLADDACGARWDGELDIDHIDLWLGADQRGPRSHELDCGTAELAAIYRAENFH